MNFKNLFSGPKCPKEIIATESMGVYEKARNTGFRVEPVFQNVINTQLSAKNGEKDQSLLF